MKKAIFEKFGSGLSREQMKNVKGGDGYGFDGSMCGQGGAFLFNCSATLNGHTVNGTTCANYVEQAVALNADEWPSPWVVTCWS